MAHSINELVHLYQQQRHYYFSMILLLIGFTTLIALALFGSRYLSSTPSNPHHRIRSYASSLSNTFRRFIPIELSSNDGRLVSTNDNDGDIITYLEDGGSLTIYNKTYHIEENDVHVVIDDDDDEDLDHQNTFSSTTLSSMSLKQHKRIKRGVLGLASMIKCIAHCNPLSYKDYGCYCGFQGEGYPVDPIDRCCYMHDLCYTRTDCNQALVYFISYKWICHKNRRASCGYVMNGSSKQQCAYQLCECDRKFAKCLSRYRCPKRKPPCRTGNRNSILSFSKLLAF